MCFIHHYCRFSHFNKKTEPMHISHYSSFLLLARIASYRFLLSNLVRYRRTGLGPPLLLPAQVFAKVHCCYNTNGRLRSDQCMIFMAFLMKPRHALSRVSKVFLRRTALMASVRIYSRHLDHIFVLASAILTMYVVNLNCNLMKLNFN